MKLKTIITISGRISSGKSYVANLIKNEFQFPIASFGKYLIYYCEQNNLPTDRETLQNTGDAFVKENPHQFLTDVISHFIGTADSIILEGLRHKSIFNEVNKLTEKQISIFIDSDLQTRYDRYFARTKDSDEVKTYEQFMISNNHPVELEIESLKPLANIVVDSTKDYSLELFTFLSQNLA